MVDILLDFIIRIERDGNWILHLEIFTAMLPWRRQRQRPTQSFLVEEDHKAIQPTAC